VRGKYNLVADALSRMHDSMSESMYTGEDGENRKQSAAEIANVSVASVNIWSAGEVQVDPAVVKELREAYENDPFYSKMYDDPGEQFVGYI
jgi:hypothetical protein